MAKKKNTTNRFNPKSEEYVASYELPEVRIEGLSQYTREKLKILGVDPDNPELMKPHLNEDGSINWNSFNVKPWLASQLTALRDQNWRQVAGMTPDMNTFNAVTGGAFNYLSPTQMARNIYNIVTGLPDFALQMVFGNNGIVTDNFALNHPYAALTINTAGDVFALNKFAGFNTALENSGKTIIKQSARNFAERNPRAVENARNVWNLSKYGLERLTSPTKTVGEGLNQRTVINWPGFITSGLMTEAAINQMIDKPNVENTVNAILAVAPIGLIRLSKSSTIDNIADLLVKVSKGIKNTLSDKLIYSLKVMLSSDLGLDWLRVFKELQPKDYARLLKRVNNSSDSDLKNAFNLLDAFVGKNLDDDTRKIIANATNLTSDLDRSKLIAIDSDVSDIAQQMKLQATKLAHIQKSKSANRIAKEISAIKLPEPVSPIAISETNDVKKFGEILKNINSKLAEYTTQENELNKLAKNLLDTYGDAAQVKIAEINDRLSDIATQKQNLQKQLNLYNPESYEFGTNFRINVGKDYGFNVKNGRYQNGEYFAESNNGTRLSLQRAEDDFGEGYFELNPKSNLSVENADLPNDVFTQQINGNTVYIRDNDAWYKRLYTRPSWITNKSKSTSFSVGGKKRKWLNYESTTNTPHRIPRTVSYNYDVIQIDPINSRQFSLGRTMFSTGLGGTGIYLGGKAIWNWTGPHAGKGLEKIDGTIYDRGVQELPDGTSRDIYRDQGNYYYKDENGTLRSIKGSDVEQRNNNNYKFVFTEEPSLDEKENTGTVNGIPLAGMNSYSNSGQTNTPVVSNDTSDIMRRVILIYGE